MAGDIFFQLIDCQVFRKALHEVRTSYVRNHVSDIHFEPEKAMPIFRFFSDTSI